MRIARSSLRGMKSKVYPDLKMGDICKAMIKDVIERNVMQPPYIALITKGQMVWGKGTREHLAGYRRVKSW